MCVQVRCKQDLISMDLLENQVLINHDGMLVNSEDVLKDKILVVYLFSAAWCGPCIPLLQMSQKMYKENKRRNCGLEIIYVSSDIEEATFIEHFKKQHDDWYAVAYGDPLAEVIRKKYGITQIPHGYVVTTQGLIVSNDARRDMENPSRDVINYWKRTMKDPIIF